MCLTCDARAFVLLKRIGDGRYVLDLWTEERAACVQVSVERLESIASQLAHLDDDEAAMVTTHHGGDAVAAAVHPQARAVWSVAVTVAGGGGGAVP